MNSDAEPSRQFSAGRGMALPTVAPTAIQPISSVFSASRAIAPPTLAPTPIIPTSFDGWTAPLRSEANRNAEASFTPSRNFSASRAMNTPTRFPAADPVTSVERPKFAFSALATTTLSSHDGSRTRTFVGAHDLAGMPTSGKVRVEPQPLSSDDVERAGKLVGKGAPNSSNVLSITRRYDEFRKLNPQITSHGVGVLGFCAQQTRCGGVNPGTGRNMAKDLLGILRAAGEAIESCPLVNAMLLGLEREYAELGAKHAPDITEDEALDFLKRIVRHDVRAALWLLLTCGARVADLLRLVDDQITMDFIARRIRIIFRVTKNRTKVSDKADISFPFMTDPDEEVVRAIASQHNLPNCDSINYVLKKAKFKFVGGRSITTYSFRRVFEHRVIEWYTDEDGITEWTKVIAWTQHKDDQALKGHYNKVVMLKVPKKPNGPGSKEPSALLEVATVDLAAITPTTAPARTDFPPAPGMLDTPVVVSEAPPMAPANIAQAPTLAVQSTKLGRSTTDSNI